MLAFDLSILLYSALMIGKCTESVDHETFATILFIMR